MVYEMCVCVCVCVYWDIADAVENVGVLCGWVWVGWGVCVSDMCDGDCALKCMENTYIR